jgi:tartrate dehydratase alpha subunit/fumarate hydratase class I-like protein
MTSNAGSIREFVFEYWRQVFKAWCWPCSHACRGFSVGLVQGFGRYASVLLSVEASSRFIKQQKTTKNNKKVNKGN